MIDTAPGRGGGTAVAMLFHTCPVTRLPSTVPYRRLPLCSLIKSLVDDSRENRDFIYLLQIPTFRQVYML